MMKFLAVTTLWFASSLAAEETALALRGSGASTAISTQQHRELILDGVFDSLCASPLEGLLGNNITCDCGFEIFPPGADVGCKTTPSCFLPSDIICATPEVSIGVNLLSIFALGFPLTINLCFVDITAFDFDVPNFIPICIGFGDGLFSLFGFNFLGVLFNTASPSAQIRSDSSPDVCNMSIGDDKCSSCTPCKTADGDDGVMFDCSSINEAYVATECSSVGTLPTSFADVADLANIHFPIFDGMLG